MATSADEDDSLTQEFQLYTVGAKSATQPILVELDLNDKRVTMEVDTGAAVSLISEGTYKKLFSGAQLKPSAIVLKTYTDERMTVAGELPVQVRYREQCVPLYLVVVAGDGPSLFGRNWLEHLQLDWRAIRTVARSETATTSLKQLLSTHENVFKDELGTVHSHQAKLHVRPDAIPKFCKARSIPFAIREAIELELDRLEATGIIEHLQLYWRAIRTVARSETATTSLKQLLSTHENVFKDELGTVHSHQAKLHVRPDAIPKFCKARSIPFAIREAIELELDRLEATGIIEKADGSERQIAFVSRTLSKSECNYAQLEKEALSLIFGVKKFHQYLYGRKFTLITDHKPLTTILGPEKGIPSLAAARLQRWAILLSAYNYEIEFKSTLDHANADGLSRLPLPNTKGEPLVCSSEPSVFNVAQIESLPVTAEQVETYSRTDPVISKVLCHTKRGWPSQPAESLKPFFQKRSELTVEHGCLLWGTS